MILSFNLRYSFSWEIFFMGVMLLMRKTRVGSSPWKMLVTWKAADLNHQNSNSSKGNYTGSMMIPWWEVTIPMSKTFLFSNTFPMREEHHYSHGQHIFHGPRSPLFTWKTLSSWSEDHSLMRTYIFTMGKQPKEKVKKQLCPLVGSLSYILLLLMLSRLGTYPICVT